MLPASLLAELRPVTGEIGKVTALAGGDIAHAWRLRSQKGEFFLKTHRNPPPGFFASEAEGLRSLEQRGVRVPRVLACTESYLLLEYIAPGQHDYRKAGAMLASLHAAGEGFYGAAQDNYLATLLQPNGLVADWAEFYLKNRLGFCLRKMRHMSERENALWQKFAEKVRPLLGECPSPAWLHGDLWSGNLLMGKDGPCFIDPACYAGDPLIDIAMTRLFGGFSQAFYDGYYGELPRRAHEDELIRIYQLYPLLVHALLFDGAACRYSGYYSRAAAIRDWFVGI
ncbi:MAG: fructosamine kinase family protein [Turneriella sp.]|nr:fructosamine kinase family protein [Leptospiraceae bacterium]MCX7632202.1 fructosamine kinase family protein [Turneriella sp.]